MVTCRIEKSKANPWESRYASTCRIYLSWRK